VDVVLMLASEEGAVTVPSEAVQNGQQGPFVFVVKDDATVESRPVEVARTYRSETVIRKGVEPGEKVVTEGQLRLVPGAKVVMKGTS
jgi:multidrug efflux system membrane fusion protein